MESLDWRESKSGVGLGHIRKRHETGREIPDNVGIFCNSVTVKKSLLIFATTAGCKWMKSGEQIMHVNWPTPIGQLETGPSIEEKCFGFWSRRGAEFLKTFVFIFLN